MAFMNRTSLHLALYESAYATTSKVVETTVSEVPKVGFKVHVGHVKRVIKNPFTRDRTKFAHEHVETIEKYVVYLGFLVFLMIKQKGIYYICLYLVMLVIGTALWMKKSLLNGVS